MTDMEYITSLLLLANLSKVEYVHFNSGDNSGIINFTKPWIVSQVRYESGSIVLIKSSLNCLNFKITKSNYIRKVSEIS